MCRTELFAFPNMQNNFNSFSHTTRTASIATVYQYYSGKTVKILPIVRLLINILLFLTVRDSV